MPKIKKYLIDYPELVAEWHPTKNGDRKPEDFTYGSGKKVWWQCVNEHEWEAQISNRTLGRGCPYCSGNRTALENSVASKYPDLTREWDCELNLKGPTNYTAKSNQKVWWKCAAGHSWKAAIYHRTIGRTGCPACYDANRSEKARPTTGLDFNLLTENPSLCEEWDFELNDLPPEHYLPTSGQLVWWRCPKGSDHIWQAKIYSRASVNNRIRNGCPFCAGRKPSEKYNLKVVNPNLAKEWHLHRNSTMPEEFTPFSNAKVWWCCDKGHEWQATINNRSNGRNCPTCSNKTSRNEIRILTELQALFPTVISRHRVGAYEVDVFIPSLNVALEYDGRWWHRNSYQKDLTKQTSVTEAGIKLLRVREEPLPAITDGDVFVDGSLPISKSDLDKIVRLISPELHRSYLKHDDFVNERAYLIYLDNFPNPFPEHSLLEQRPEIAEQWHPTKNSPLTPLNFTPGSSYKAWWRCDNGHEWRAIINNRCGKNRGCPYCSGRYP